MYRYDADLEFLGEMTNEDLALLANVIIFDPKDQKKRLTEGVTSTEEYQKYGKQYKMYWKVLAEELQKYGGDSIVNVLRGGKGVLYKEILLDAASKVVDDLDKKASVIDIENNYIKSLLDKAFDKMSEDEKKAFLSEIYSACLEKNLKGFADNLLSVMKEGSKQALNFLLKNLSDAVSSLTKSMGSAVGRAIGPTLATILLKNIFGVASATVAKEATKGAFMATLGSQAVASRGPAGADGAGMTKETGVIVAIILGLCLLPTFTSKALRITIPACFIVAMLRIKYLSEHQ